MDIRLTARTLGMCAATGVALLLCAHLAVQALRFASGNHSLFGLVTMFSLGSDRNLPTVFSTLLIFVCALLLGLAGRGAARIQALSSHWYALSGIFAFLALDEILEIHERLIDPMRRVFNAGGYLYYAWVIPYGVATLLIVAAFARFLLRLPARSRSLFIAAGSTFVAGAIGMEMLGGWHAEQYGNDNIGYVAWQTVEELLEMTGMALFLYALADYLEQHAGGLSLTLGR